MVTICRAKLENATDIKKLLYKTWISTYSSYYTQAAIDTITSDWHSLDLLRKQILEKDRFFIVAKFDSKIVGMCNTATIGKDNVINIQRIHVDPDYQRKGIGSMLIMNIIDSYPRATKITLEVERQNNKAVAFYRKLGFKTVGKKTFEIQSIRIPCYLMEKSQQAIIDSKYTVSRVSPTLQGRRSP